MSDNLPFTILTIVVLMGSGSLGLASARTGDRTAQMENSSSPAPDRASSSFSDIGQNIYKSEILQAYELKIVQGFPDGTFRPDRPVTREQAVSMIVDAIATLTPVDLNARPTRPVRPFTDVPSDRWSAAKIAWAQWNIAPAGTPTGKFRPTDYITRSELVSFLRREREKVRPRSTRPSGLYDRRARSDA